MAPIRISPGLHFHISRYRISRLTCGHLTATEAILLNKTTCIQAKLLIISALSDIIEDPNIGSVTAERRDVWQGIRCGLQVCPSVSPKFWRFMGCRKLTFNLNFGILRCSAFRICKTLWGLKWTGALLGANHNHLVVLLALKGRSHSKKRGPCRRMRGGRVNPS